MIAVWVTQNPFPPLNEGAEIKLKLHVLTHANQALGLNIVGVAYEDQPANEHGRILKEAVHRRLRSRVDKPKRSRQVVREILCS